MNVKERIKKGADVLMRNLILSQLKTKLIRRFPEMKNLESITYILKNDVVGVQILKVTNFPNNTSPLTAEEISKLKKLSPVKVTGHIESVVLELDYVNKCISGQIKEAGQPNKFFKI
jgi:hypothetical protein